MAALTSYSWPGNIRELQNLVQRAVILSDHGLLPNLLPTAILRGLTAREWPGKITNAVESTNANCYELQPISGEKTNLQSDKTSVADEYERRQRDEIARVLTACRGRGGGADGAAARLGVNRTTLLWRMKKYGIYAKQYA